METKAMRKMKVPPYFGSLFLSMFLLTSRTSMQVLHAQTQAPAAGAPVVVRMLEAVDSGKDLAGKQYRARINKAADAGNGVTIPLGAAATVTLAKDGSGYSAHLTSVTINGQTVAVATGPASVSSGLQGAANNAMSTVGSMLGGFGHHASTPGGVTAVAMGQRVVLPPGITLTFVLSQPPAANPAGSGGQPLTASASPASMGGGGASAAGASNLPVSNQPVSSGALTATIQETLLGPSKKAAGPGLENPFVVSPDGGHYAVPAMHGSRELMIVDGVDGPEFDHAAHGSGGQAIDFVFSSDGKHSAYVAQSGNDMVEVRDGKTAFTITSVNPGANGAQNGSVQQIDQSRIHNPDAATNSLVHQCVISPSGAHVAVVSLEAGLYRMFLDGVKSPPYRSIDLSKIAFVAEKLIYAAQTNDGKWHVVVNDKLGPAHDGVLALLVNDDNSHYAVIAGDGGSNGSNQLAVADGVPGTPHRGTIRNMTIASNGRVAYAAVVGGTPGSPNGSNDLYVDDHDIGPAAVPFAVLDPSEKTNGTQAYVLFSPDGKRFAFTRRIAGGVATVVDGKVGRPYDNIGVFQFSPDSKHELYVGSRNSQFVVFDGQEMEGEGTVKYFVFSKTGGHLAYLAYGPTTGFHMVVDGKASPRFQEYVAHSMSFSEDGKHYAYAVHVNFSQCQIVRDGVATNVPSVVPFNTRTRSNVEFPPLLFSSDGTRLVWVWPISGGAGNVIGINGQEIVHGLGNYEFPEFSPDSKRFATMIWTGKNYALSVDGKTGPIYDDFLEVNPNVARFLDSHTFRYLGVKGGMVYRVVVDLGG
jgi:WD40 repeat protein